MIVSSVQCPAMGNSNARKHEVAQCRLIQKVHEYQPVQGQVLKGTLTEALLRITTFATVVAAEGLCKRFST